MENVKFGEFVVGDYFEAILGKSLTLTEAGIRVVSGVTDNNGTSGFTTMPNEVFENEITISNRGEYSGTAFFQDGEFTLFNNVICLKSLNSISSNTKMYITAVVNKLPYGGYDHYPTKSSIIEDILILPMVDENTPDWDYMDNYIKEIKIRKTKEIIESYSHLDKQKYELEDVEFGEFKIGDIFKVESGDSISPIVKDKGDIKRVTATTKNNGVSGYIDYIDGIKTSNNSIVGNKFGDFNYIKGLFSYSGNVVSITGDYNELSALYIVCVLNKSINGFSFSNRLGAGKIKKLKVRLPEKDGKPDYEYMEKYINKVMIKTIDKIEEENNREIDEMKKMEVNL